MKEFTPRLLLADDQVDVLVALRLLLKGEGYLIEEAQSPVMVVDLLQAREFDVILMDLNYTRDTTSGQEGLDLLHQLQQLDSTIPVVVMTAWSSIELVVEAMKRGAKDFIQKPWDNARLLTILKNQVELRRALRDGQLLEEENRILRAGDESSEFIAKAESMQLVLEMIERIGPSDANVLILGENGTGKTLVAKALHTASNRAGKPFITVNAGGLSEGVFASEMFGHVKGAFTDAKSDRVGRFELADQGTLFLDEIANVPLGQQAKLLRVIETGDFERVGSSKTRKADVRILSATNADIKKEIQSGNFREDLLYRLNTVEITLPPLRERKEDIPGLALFFLKSYADRYRKRVSRLSNDSLDTLKKYAWPGNIRELNHTIERAVLMARTDMIHVTDLGLRQEKESSPGLDDMSLDEVELHLIKKTMQKFNGNVTQAAKALGLSRTALYRRLEKHGL